MKNFKLSALSVLLVAVLLLAACAPRAVPAAETPIEEPSVTEPAPAQIAPEQPESSLPEPQLPEEPVPQPDSTTLTDPIPPSGSVELDSDPDISEPDGEPSAPYYNIAPTGRLDISALALSPAPSFNLTIPQNFKVTRPGERDSYKVTTEYATYFITGTSNPGQTLYFDGREVERLGSKGTWGAWVELGMGNNVFTARQGDASTTVTITRRAPAGVSAITAITQSSMYPATQGGVKVGGTLPVECVAPSGGTVVASFGGRSVTLQQTASANTGVPATYKGELPVDGDYPSGVTTKIGKVSYQLTFNGSTTGYQSSGDVFVAGTGSYIAVRVTAYLGFVYPDPAQPSVFREKLKTGATDYVYSENNTHYRLYSGGYIPKGLCEIITGEVSIGNKISSVTPYFHEKRETYSFSGIGTSVYNTQYKDGVFYLTFYNTVGNAPADASRSRLFSTVGVTQGDDNTVTYAFTLKNTALWWGYQVWYDGADTVVRFQYKPSLSGDSGQPLKGVTVMLDPGHGKNDPGALGIAALVGPDENTLNLANAYALRDELASMGAQVLFTRSQLGEYLSLDERLQAFEGSDADIYISLHHNSLAESTNANTVTGTEIYYHIPTTQKSAQSILDNVTAFAGRVKRQANQGYYRVTISNKAPSMLIELGFITHPVEYERCCDPEVIRQAARGIAQGLVQALA